MSMQVSAGWSWRWDYAKSELTYEAGLEDVIANLARDDMERLGPFDHVVHKQDFEFVKASLSTPTKSNDRIDIVVRLQATEGGYNRFRLRCVVDFDDLDLPKFAIGYCDDITAHERVLEELSDRAGQFENLAENIPGAINRYIILEDGRHVLEYVSQGFFELTGLSRADIDADASKVWSIIHPDDVNSTMQSVEKATLNLERWEHTFRIRTSEGQLRWLHGRGKTWRRADDSIVFDSIFVDVSKIKEMEVELLKNNEMLLQTQKLDTIGRLTGGIAHDFNNLLAVMVGNLELIKDSTDDPEVHEFADSALNAGGRGSELVRKMLGFARQAELELGPVDINSVARASRPLLQRTVPANISFKLELGQELPVVQSDKSFVESALLNLVLNACDAMPNGGDICLSTRAVAVEHGSPNLVELPAGDYVELVVSDNGSGISADQIERVFDPFFSTKRNESHKGRGMGLAVVDGFMRQTGGAARVESTPGVLTRFTLLFPADREISYEIDVPTKQVSTGTQRGLSVLVAEDDPAVANMLRKSLGSLGHAVAIAENGAEAMAMFERDGPFDLLISDRIMPGEIQGDEVCALVRERSPGFPVIQISGYWGVEDSDSDVPSQAIIRLSKPILRAELASAIQNALSSINAGGQ